MRANKPGRPENVERNAKMLRLRKAGFSYTEIGRMVQPAVSRQVARTIVRRWLKREAEQAGES